MFSFLILAGFGGFLKREVIRSLGVVRFRPLSRIPNAVPWELNSQSTTHAFIKKILPLTSDLLYVTG